VTLAEAGRPRRLGANLFVVLNQPQDLINVAGVVRAMANMGLERLTLVDAPEFDPWRITGIAHRTHPIVDQIRRTDTLAEALAEANYVVGTSARPRTAQRNYRRPREVASGIVRRAAEGPVALVFGREDRGLSNEDLDRCHEVLVVPTAREYSSLNLAQAVLLVAYEVLLASGVADQPLPEGKRSLGPASAANLEEMYSALEEGLARAGFFKARKAESVMRTIRTVFGRTTLDAHEARLLRSVGYEVRNRIAKLEVAKPDAARAEGSRSSPELPETT